MITNDFIEELNSKIHRIYNCRLFFVPSHAGIGLENGTGEYACIAVDNSFCYRGYAKTNEELEDKLFKQLNKTI